MTRLDALEMALSILNHAPECECEKDEASGACRGYGPEICSDAAEMRELLARLGSAYAKERKAERRRNEIRAKVQADLDARFPLSAQSRGG